jgi:hypothetical protein
MLNFFIPKFGYFYNGFYAIKGYQWFGKIKGTIIRNVYSYGYKVNDKVVINSEGFIKIKYHKDFPFDLYDRY